MATYMTATSCNTAANSSTNNSSVARKMCSTGISSLATFSTSFSQASKFTKLVLFNSNFRYGSYSHHRLLDTTCTSKRAFTPVEELNVTIHRSSLIAPEKKTERKSMFLSNIDVMLDGPPICTLFFFNNNPDFPPKTVIEMLETAYRKILVPYDFLAGRFTFDQTGRLEIDCNSAGAGFVVASSELSLEDLGDLITPNKDYEKLRSTQVNNIDINDQPLFFLQVTSFKCGGFTLGFSFSHSIFDGFACKFFIEDLVSLLWNQSRIVPPPQNNRRLLSARSPLQVGFPHKEYLKFKSQRSELSLPWSSTTVTEEPRQWKIFYLSPNDIINLKDEAKMINEENSNQKKVSEFNVILAHIWRCIGLAKYTGNEAAKQTFSAACVNNIRNKLRPRLPSTYTGNGVYCSLCTATCDELEVGPFSRLVQRITESAEKQLTDEYLRSAIDNMQLQKGITLGNINVTIWSILGLTDIMFPWGKPEWNCPVVTPNASGITNSIVYVLPDQNRIGPKGVNILTSLRSTETEKFESLFGRFLGR